MEDSFNSRRLYRYINIALIYTYIVFASARLVLYSIEYFCEGRRDPVYALTNLVCVAYGTAAIYLRRTGKVSEELVVYFTTELTIILMLIYGHIFEPQHTYIFSLCSMGIFFFIQVPNLTDYPWVRYAASVKQMVYVIAAGVASGQVVIKTYSDLMMPAAPLFCLFAALVYQLDINRMIMWHAQLQETREQLKAVISVCPVGLFVIKNNGEVVLANLLAMRKLEVERIEDISSRLPVFSYASEGRAYPFETEAQVVSADISHYLSQSNQTEVNFGLTSLSNRTFSWLGNRTTWDGEAAAVIVIKDVTSILQLEAIRAESQYKNLMLRSVSHELRTPTYGIQHAVASVAENPETSAWAKVKLKVAEIFSNQLLMTIDDLLDYSQMVVGSFSLNKQPFPLRDSVLSTVNMISLIAQQKQIQVVVNIDPLLPDMAFNDQRRMSQVLLNLLSNALKFTYEGGRVELNVTLNQTGFMELEVKDNGIGIPTDHLASLFRVFTQVNSNTSMNPQGCGLGLHISNLISQLLGYEEIKVQSVEGRGSVFTCVVDIFQADRLCTALLDEQEEGLATEQEEMPTLEIPLFSSQSKTLPKLLVVDDAPFNRMVVKDFLLTAALQCLEVESGKDCISLVMERARTDNPIELIIMDFEMPEMDGPTTARTLAAQLTEAHLAVPKIIAHTAYVSSGDRQTCRDAGMIDFIGKPCTRLAFISTVKHHLRE
jgi:signal transduction histidine kinase